MKRTSKILAATGLAGSMLLGGIGLASAQTATTNSTTTATATTARPDPSTRIKTALAPLVTAGTITQAQADAIATSMAASNVGFGRGGHGGGGKGFGSHAATIAKVLGISTTDLQTALSADKTVAQLATEKGVNLQTVIAAVVVEEQAEHPTLTAAEVTTRVTNMVNGVRTPKPARSSSTTVTTVKTTAA